MGTVVTVKPFVPTVTPAGPTNFCPGTDSITLSGPASGYTYQWLLNNAPITGATSASYVIKNPGIYSVLLTNTANSCSDTSTPRNVQVFSTPPTVSLSPAGSATICSNDSLLLQAVSATGVLQGQWFLNNTIIPGATAGRYGARTFSGEYRVRILDNNGCQSDTSAPVTVLVNPSPTANIAYAGGLSFCQGSSLVLNTQTEAGNAIQWSINGLLNPQDNAPIKTVSTSGTFRIKTSNSYGCSTLSAPVTVTVFPSPQPVITRTGLTLRVSNSQQFNYQWYKDGIPIPNELYRSYTVTAIGSYYVLVTDANGCVGNSATEFFNTTGVNDVSADEIKLYPNPATTVLKIAAPVRVNASLRDLAGRELLRVENAHEIELSALSEGVYFVQLTDEKGVLLKVEKIFRRR